MFRSRKMYRELSAVVLISALISLPAVAMSTTYYVDDTGGNDGNNGLTPATAWKTITHAAATVPTGTSGTPNVIMVAAGTYDNTTNTETFPINFTNNYVSLTGAGSGTTFIDAENLNDALDVDAMSFSVSGFTFQNAPDAIEISEGGFTITGNVFDTTVSDGIYANRSTSNLTSDFSYPTVSITGNTFMTTTRGIEFYVRIDSDYATENLTMSIGDVVITGNAFPLTGGTGIEVSGFYIEDLLNGTATVGNFTASNNTFTNGFYGIDYDSQIYYVEDSQITVGNVDVSNNTSTDQAGVVIDIDYWDVEDVYGDSSITLGNLTVSNNNITSDTIANPGCRGIDIDGIGDIEDIFDETVVTTGTTSISNNSVNVNDHGLYLYISYIEYLGEEYWGDTVQVTLGPINITDNTITSVADYGAYVEYYDMAYETYGQSQVILQPLAVTGNTIYSYDEAFIFYVSYWGDNMDEDSSLLVQNITIVNNTFFSTNNGGAIFDIDEAAYDMSGNSNVTVESMNISANDFVSSSGDALYFLFDDFAYYMYDNSSFLMNPITINGNGIFATNGDGIYIEYYSYYVASNMEDNSSAVTPDWIITNNTIDVTGGYTGIDLYTYSNPDDNYDHASAHYGSMLIDNNLFNINVDAGMDYGVYLYIEDVVEDAYGPTTTTFGDITITNNSMYALDNTGIYLYYNDIGYDFTGAPTLTMGDIEIASNLINTAPTGIEGYFDNLYAEDAATVTFGEFNIHDNTLTNISNTGIFAFYYNVNNDPGSASLTIGAPIVTDNIITGSSATGDGIIFEVVNDSDDITFGLTTITGNSISGFDTGIYLEDIEEASISCNYLENNAQYGILLENDGTNFPVNNNSFVNNNVGLSIGDGSHAVVDAENNWWGDKLGPVACASCNGVNPGTTGTIDYDPWLVYQIQQSRCGKPFPWVMFTPATTGMSPLTP